MLHLLRFVGEGPRIAIGIGWTNPFPDWPHSPPRHAQPNGLKKSPAFAGLLDPRTRPR